MKKHKLTYLLLALITVNIGISAYNSFNTPKIAYVRSQELIYGYLGMKEAQSEYQEKTQAWQANVDTLELDYQRAVNKYNQDIGSLTESETLERQAILKAQQSNLIGYADAVDKKAKEEDEQMTQGSLNQINSFIEQYGEDQGYDAIFGTTVAGNLLYGKDAIDITDQVLDAMNKNYLEG